MLRSRLRLLMEQCRLFDRPEVARAAELPPAGDPDSLRPYQREAVECIAREFASVRSTMLVIPTGSGKTRTIVALFRGYLHGEINF